LTRTGSRTVFAPPISVTVSDVLWLLAKNSSWRDSSNVRSSAAEYAALRVEGRGYWTLINSSGNLFCSGGCTVTIKGDTLQQLEMLIGLSARF
jgi:hypothetical protein